MPLLLLFALIAGAGTAITPCVLPVLPALLSAGAVGGRRRPFGIVVGLAHDVHDRDRRARSARPGRRARERSCADAGDHRLIGFGLVLLIPSLAARVQAPLSRLARFGPKTRGDGFWSGVGVGGALGFVCAPCAGPILAAVTSVSASSGPTAQIVAVAIAYALGLSAVMLLYALGGRAVLERIRRRARGHLVEPVLGAILLLTAVAMATNLDVRFEEALAKDRSLPAFLVNPTRALENSHAVQSRLASLRPPPKFANASASREQPPAPRPGTGVHRHPALVQHARRAAADAATGCAVTSCSSTSGPTRASTASARCRSSRGCMPPITATGSDRRRRDARVHVRAERR